MLNEPRETDADQPQDGRAVGRDQGHGAFLFRPPAGGVFRQQLRGLGGFKHLMKADFFQPVQHQVNIPHMLKLTIEGRFRDCYTVTVVTQPLQIIAHRFNGAVGAHLDAAPTINTPVRQDQSLSPPDPDGLGRTVLDAGRAAPAAIPVQDNRVLHRSINSRLHAVIIRS